MEGEITVRQTIGIGDIEFPVAFDFVEDPEFRVILRSVAELETTVEFCDDWHERYRAWDAVGRVLRLRIEELTLLLAMVVPNGWTRDELALEVSHADDGSFRVVEMSGGQPHRGLVVRETADGWTAEPLIPPPALNQPGGSYRTKELVEFDRWWVRRAFGRKLTRSNADSIAGWVVA